ncbi:MAG: alpha/beta hydrolase [Spirochaetia bacterium]|nr:alpha/beta hydrolase [Spirochaetia bacterium]MCF7953563.1 alpha/beta hydrolase [Spirochaetales bacterium]
MQRRMNTRNTIRLTSRIRQMAGFSLFAATMLSALLFTASCSTYSYVQPDFSSMNSNRQTSDDSAHASESKEPWADYFSKKDELLIIAPPVAAADTTSDAANDASSTGDVSTGDVSRGMVFYPGGLVDPKAYLPLMWEISRITESMSVIVPMPFNLAVFGAGKGEKVPRLLPDIENWYIAGHSLGGAMAAKLVHDNPDLFSGLILFAAYPGKADPLTDYSIPVLSIYAENDGLATKETIKEKQFLLPGHTEYFKIEGGNHAQFGSYGIQKNDGRAEISPAEQWEQTAEAVDAFISRF